MARVFVLGLAAMDFILSVDRLPAEASKFTADDARIVGGGGGANAAVAVARLGGRADLAARFGADAVAELILSELVAEAVDVTRVHKTAGARSSFSSILIDASGGRQIVNFRGSGLTRDTGWIAPAPDVDAILVDSRWPEGALAALKIARNRGIFAILDAEAPVDPTLLAAASHVAFSRQGLASLTPETDMARALGQVRDRISGWCCVTDGENGVYYTQGRAIRHVPAFRVKIRDTLAAGDIWHGAFALGLAEGMGEAGAISFANAAAALKCTELGGRAGCPDRAATQALLDRSPPRPDAPNRGTAP